MTRMAYFWSPRECVRILRQLRIDITNNIRYCSHRIQGWYAKSIAVFLDLAPKEADSGPWLCNSISDVVGDLENLTKGMILRK